MEKWSKCELSKMTAPTNEAEKKTDIWTKCLWSVCLYSIPTQIYELYHSLKQMMTWWWWWWWWLFKCHLHREGYLPSLSEMTTPTHHLSTLLLYDFLSTYHRLTYFLFILFIAISTPTRFQLDGKLHQGRDEMNCINCGIKEEKATWES